jgi:hypothetical protein
MYRCTNSPNIMDNEHGMAEYLCLMYNYPFVMVINQGRWLEMGKVLLSDRCCPNGPKDLLLRKSETQQIYCTPFIANVTYERKGRDINQDGR